MRSPMFVKFSILLALASFFVSPVAGADHVRDLQARAVADGSAAWGHWGTQPEQYSNWKSHSNRLIPVYTFGIGLEAVAGQNSVYRSEDALRKLYGRLPESTLNPSAEYFDQTDVYRLQQMAAEAGKKHIILVVFDGMDWQSTWAAAIHRTQSVAYREGRGSGLHFQDYRGAPTEFGFFVTSPHNDGTKPNVDSQTVENPGGTTPGGYDPRQAGSTPWARPPVPDYIIAKSRDPRHAYTDSASSATSLTAGIKTYNDAINVDAEGRQVEPIAQKLQRDGFAIGIVTSVPISHATPACAYANNVHRDDYQDLTRDLIGLPSVAHREEPLPGVDVLLGAGWGDSKKEDKAQGANFIPGNRYLTDEDLAKIDTANGGEYATVLRKAGVSGKRMLNSAAALAKLEKSRLFGFFGVSSGHLPFSTADGGYDPAPSIDPKQTDKYSPADIEENPTLADMTHVALDVLAKRSDRFWLMVEAGDVDWANHQNNIDCSVGATLDGDRAFRVITDWVEAHNAWDTTAVILTADHGHYLVLDQPEALIAPHAEASEVR